MSTPDLPCPFCGGTDLRLGQHSLDPECWFITCWNCDCEGPSIEAELADEADAKARELWNKRTLGRSEYSPSG